MLGLACLKYWFCPLQHQGFWEVGGIKVYRHPIDLLDEHLLHILDKTS